MIEMTLSSRLRIRNSSPEAEHATSWSRRLPTILTGSNKAYAAFDSSRVLSVDEDITFPCENREKSQTFKHPFYIFYSDRVCHDD